LYSFTCLPKLSQQVEIFSGVTYPPERKAYPTSLSPYRLARLDTIETPL